MFKSVTFLYWIKLTVTSKCQNWIYQSQNIDSLNTKRHYKLAAIFTSVVCSDGISFLAISLSNLGMFCPHCFFLACRQIQSSSLVVPISTDGPKSHRCLESLNVLMCFLCYKWVNFYDLRPVFAPFASSNSSFDNGLAFLCAEHRSQSLASSSRKFPCPTYFIRNKLLIELFISFYSISPQPHIMSKHPWHWRGYLNWYS